VETLTYSSGRASGCDSPGLLNSLDSVITLIRLRRPNGETLLYKIRAA
jgi:hypothetical protein